MPLHWVKVDRRAYCAVAHPPERPRAVTADWRPTHGLPLPVAVRPWVAALAQDLAKVRRLGAGGDERDIADAA
jgi:hypothetical protein